MAGFDLVGDRAQAVSARTDISPEKCARFGLLHPDFLLCLAQDSKIGDFVKGNFTADIGRFLGFVDGEA